MSQDYDPFKAFFEQAVELGYIEIDQDTGIYVVVNIKEVNKMLFGS